eukprot:g35394.t1
MSTRNSTRNALSHIDLAVPVSMSKVIPKKEDWVLTKPEKKSLLGGGWVKQFLSVKDGKFKFSDSPDAPPNRQGDVLGVRVLESNREQKEGVFLWKIYYHNPATLAAESMKQKMTPVLIKSETKPTRKEWLAAFDTNGAQVDNITLLEGNLTYLGTYDTWKHGKKQAKPLYALVYKGVLQFYKTRKDWSDYNPSVEIDLLQGSELKLCPPESNAIIFSLTDHFGIIHILSTGTKEEGDKWMAAIKKCIFAPKELNPQPSLKKLNTDFSDLEIAQQAVTSPVRENQFFTMPEPAAAKKSIDSAKPANSGKPNSPAKEDSDGPPVHFRGASFDISNNSGVLSKITSAEPGVSSISE